MKNLCRNKGIEALLDEMLRLLDAGHIQREIAVPLDNAAAAFKMEANAGQGESSPATLVLATAGAFVQWLYRYGLRVPRILDIRQAESEAVFILEHSYSGHTGGGYEAALLEAMTQYPDSIAPLLRFLLAAVKQAEQQRHIRWVLQTLTSPLDWTTKKSLLLQLFERGGEVFPPELIHSPEDRFVNHFPQLLMNYVEAQSKLRRLIG